MHERLVMEEIVTLFKNSSLQQLLKKDIRVIRKVRQTQHHSTRCETQNFGDKLSFILSFLFPEPPPPLLLHIFSLLLRVQ
jgi:hypothetical protein